MRPMSVTAVVLLSAVAVAAWGCGSRERGRTPSSASSTNLVGATAVALAPLPTQTDSTESGETPDAVAPQPSAHDVSRCQLRRKRVDRAIQSAIEYSLVANSIKSQLTVEPTVIVE